jgi:hypothetical protein
VRPSQQGNHTTAGLPKSNPPRPGSVMPRQLDRGAGYSGKTGLTRVGWLKIGAVQIRSAPTRGNRPARRGRRGFCVPCSASSRRSRWLAFRCIDLTVSTVNLTPPGDAVRSISSNSATRPVGFAGRTPDSGHERNSGDCPSSHSPHHGRTSNNGRETSQFRTT